MTELMIDLQGGAKAPLYEKIYEHIKHEIVEGRLARGEKLPSTRRLALHLAVSRSTVELAYEQLLAEGYISAKPCQGFFVCDITGLYQLCTAELQAERAAEQPAPSCWLVDFSPYAIDTTSFPYNVWRKINKNILLDDREELLFLGDRRGEQALREVIAEYLHQARGVNCQASELILGAGNEYLEILLSQLLGAGQTILMENPGYPQAYRTFCNMGYQVETIPAEATGITAAAVRSKNPSLVYVMPSHQFPVGSVMPLGQRLELLEWAAESEERYLIEDDHDSEYRYRGKPIPSLQSIDRGGKVIYLGTFSKSIAPSLRISYMVLPHQLMKRYYERCGFYSTTVPRMQQEVLQVFLQEGHFERHLNKMRGVYRGRRDFLIGELKKRDWVCAVSGEAAGLHLLVTVRTTMAEEAVCRAARAQGVNVTGLQEYALPAAAVPQECGAQEQVILLLGYGGPTEEEIGQGLDILEEIIAGGK